MTPSAIRSLRESLGLSPARFAALVGVSLRAVQYWERGHTRPSRLALARLEQLQQNGGHAKEISHASQA